MQLIRTHPTKTPESSAPATFQPMKFGPRPDFHTTRRPPPRTSRPEPRPLPARFPQNSSPPPENHFFRFLVRLLNPVQIAPTATAPFPIPHPASQPSPMSPSLPEDPKKHQPPCPTPANVTRSTDEAPIVRLRADDGRDPAEDGADPGKGMVLKLRNAGSHSGRTNTSICSGVLVPTTLGSGIQYPHDGRGESDANSDNDSNAEE